MEYVNITERMQSVKNDLDDSLRGLYTVQEFEYRLALLEAYRDTDPSAVPSIFRELYRMLDSCGIPYERRRKLSYYRDLVNRMSQSGVYNLENRLLAILFARFEYYPDPGKYMARIVEMQQKKEDFLPDDTLRVRILKQFIRCGDYLTAAGYRSREFIRSQIAAQIGHTPSDAEVLAELDDGIFAKAEEERQRLIAEAETAAAPLIAQRDSLRKSRDEAKEARRAAKKKDDADAVAALDKLIAEAKKNLAPVDKRIENLHDALAALNKPDGRYGLLKLSDDLACGKFRSQGSTRRGLYLFAIVFGMKYGAGADPSDPSDLPGRIADMESSLFREYYTNNLMRYITEGYRGHETEFEDNPTGQGINYKNFAEVVYLYYLTRPEMTPREKIAAASKMIAQLTKEHRQRGKEKKIPSADTVRYRDMFMDEILTMDAETLFSFLGAHFDCDPRLVTRDPGTGAITERDVGPMQIAAEQTSAYREYTALTEELARLSPEDADMNYGLFFAEYDGLADDRQAKQDILAYLHREDAADGPTDARFRSFLQLIRNFDRFLKEKRFKVSAPEQMSRTALVAAFYYCYNARHLYDDYDATAEGGTNVRKSFNEVFDSYTRELNPILARANYHCLSAKNIFDILLVFSSYAYIYYA